VPELKRLSDLDVIRLVDMVLVAKSGSGELVRLQAGGLSEPVAARLGSIADLLVGLTTEDADDTEDPGAGAEPTDLRAVAGDDGTWSVVDVIPTGAMCVVALIEHGWAIPLRDAFTGPGAEPSPTRGFTQTTPCSRGSDRPRDGVMPQQQPR
jgi:hypothetical protein